MSEWVAIDQASERECKWVSDWVIDWASEWVSERVSRRVSKWVTVWLSDWLTDWLSDWGSEWVSDWVRDRPSQWVSDRVSEWVIEWVSEWVSDPVSECVSEWVSYNPTCMTFSHLVCQSYVDSGCLFWIKYLEQEVVDVGISYYSQPPAGCSTLSAGFIIPLSIYLDQVTHTSVQWSLRTVWNTSNYLC